MSLHNFPWLSMVCKKNKDWSFYLECLKKLSLWLQWAVSFFFVKTKLSFKSTQQASKQVSRVVNKNEIIYFKILKDRQVYGHCFVINCTCNLFASLNLILKLNICRFIFLYLSGLLNYRSALFFGPKQYYMYINC